MRYQFDSFTLDTDRGLLVGDSGEVPTEPRAFQLLTHIVVNHDRVVSKDEIVEVVWSGRVVSDAAIATVIKTARKALGDDGASQRYIRTLRGRGLRFVGQVRKAAPAMAAVRNEAVGDPAKAPAEAGIHQSSRPTLAILPFRMVGYSAQYAAISDAIPAELISSLSRLRWLTVVSRGSTFRFREESPDLEAVRIALGARYCLTGLVELFGAAIAVSVELCDTGSGAVIWSERFSGVIEDVDQTRNDIVTHLISALELHVPLHEAERARLRPFENLDAWAVYHLGLQHMYRFNRSDNEIAAAYFERAAKLEPRFARAHAARSFTSFQNAFLRYVPDVAAEIENAQVHAERCIDLDPIDPFGNFTLGRAHWLRGDPEAGMPWIDRAVELSPNFAQGFYAHGWADVMAGRSDEALKHLSRAVSLSPLDPFLYAMRSAQGLAHMLEGDMDLALESAERGARTPGAHFLILAIAAMISQIGGNGEKALYWSRKTREFRPDASVGMFFDAFPFEDPATRRRVRAALLAVGLRDG